MLYTILSIIVVVGAVYGFYAIALSALSIQLKTSQKFSIKDKFLGICILDVLIAQFILSVLYLGYEVIKSRINFNGASGIVRLSAISYIILFLIFMYLLRSSGRRGKNEHN